MILYHFTSTVHLPLINAAGALTTTESNLSPTREHAGPDVVWLTSDPEPDAEGHALAGSCVDKTAVRITVDVPDAEVWGWLPWSRGHRIPKKWARHLERGRRPATWYVMERPIPRAEWVAVDVQAAPHT